MLYNVSVMVDEKLNPKQETFCNLYATDRSFFGNGVQAYIEAYDPDQSRGNWYKSAQASASRLLSNVIILARINELLELHGLNDTFVDKQLELLITQNADTKTKLGAIKEYNNLKTRITKNIDIKSDGEKVAVTGIVISNPNDKKGDTDSSES